MKAKKEKKVKAWAYMATDSKKGKYMVTDNKDMVEIYLSNPGKTYNPFNLELTWRPTPITITYKL